MNIRKIYEYALMKNYCLLFLFGIILSSCVSQLQPKEGPSAVSAFPENGAAHQEDYPYPADALNGVRFNNLPAEAREYLITLAEAFSKKDKAYLLSQGETQYEKELRDKYDEDAYFAMLYRTGPYSEETGWMPAALPKLDYALVKGIEYTSYAARGQMLEIKGRLYLENNETVPCEIMLIWRLLKPKILGAYP